MSNREAVAKYKANLKKKFVRVDCWVLPENRAKLKDIEKKLRKPAKL